MPPRNEVDKICEYAKSLGNNDLQALIAKLEEENARRERIQREEDWRAVSFAIKNYIEKWGSISVYTEDLIINVDSRSELDTFGEIDATY